MIDPLLETLKISDSTVKYRFSDDIILMIKLQYNVDLRPLHENLLYNDQAFPLYTILIKSITDLKIVNKFIDSLPYADKDEYNIRERLRMGVIVHIKSELEISKHL